MNPNSPFPPSPGRQQIRAARGPKQLVDPQKVNAHWDEFEIANRGEVAATRVLLLAGSECRFTCTMCDLWRHTLDHATKPGDLVTQIEQSLKRPWELPSVPTSSIKSPHERWIKLYNSSNFFDPYNVPVEDLIPIAQLLPNFTKVIVENHPRLLPPTIPHFRDAINGKLEIAMGLETTDPLTLKWLNKGMALADFSKAMEQLRQWQIDARVFLLLGLPSKSFAESLESCLQSIAFAAEAGVRHCSVIPTRTQHGVMSQLTDMSRVPLITASDLEFALSQMVGRWPSIITVDLWDWNSLPGHCDHCRETRKQRLEMMCLLQENIPLTPQPCNCYNTDKTASI